MPLNNVVITTTKEQSKNHLPITNYIVDSKEDCLKGNGSYYMENNKIFSVAHSAPLDVDILKITSTKNLPSLDYRKLMEEYHSGQ